MSDSFANEFEKWLQRSSDGGNIDETEEDESYEENEYVLNTVYDDVESDKEKSPNHPSGKQTYGLMSESINDQAPILVDDDDDDDEFFSRRRHFEDEPPVLEPAFKQQYECESPAIGISYFMSHKNMRNYSRNNHMHSRKTEQYRLCKSIKTYSNKDRMRNLSFESYDEPRGKDLVKPKNVGEGENIFDRFSSDSYEDLPPPLIPSPEALQQCPESPKRVVNHPVHSPDFCAVEADSTSEIKGDKACCPLQSRRVSKNSAHGDVMVECDSTCMLSASPIIVSPASLCNGEVEEMRGPGDEGSQDDRKQINDFDSEKCSDSPELRGKNDLHLPTDTAVSDVLNAKDFKKCDTAVSNVLNGKDIIKYDEDPVLQIAETIISPSYQDLPSVDTSGAEYKTFHVNANIEIESDSACEFPNEPPLLSIISPLPRLHKHRRSRKKRHTIDSAETYSRSRKRSHSIPSPQAETDDSAFDISIPPVLTCVSETLITLNCRGKHPKIVSQHSKLNCSCCHKGRHHKRKRRRHNTIPFTHESEHYGQLSDDLCIFIDRTSELSQLQTHMHMLLCYLFPQLKSELDTMSPESYHFENLISNLVMSLEQADELQDSSALPPLILHEGNEDTTVSETTLTSEQSYDFQSISNKSSSQSSSIEAAFLGHTLEYDPVGFPDSSFLTSSDYHSNMKKQHHILKEQWNISQDSLSDNITPQMSKLTLKDVEEIVKPSKVLLCKDPVLSLKRFSQLSCRILQLLLPDLPVSLCSEFVGSTHDLILFIENVLLTNTRQRQH